MTKTIKVTYLQTVIGELVLGALGDDLCLLDYRYRKTRESVDLRLQLRLKAEFAERPSDVTAAAQRQVEEYLAGQRREFTIPYLTAGTAFQQDVWEQIALVPYGQTISYLELATRVGNPKAVRAAASATGANALALLLPCHRIIGSGGSLGGYAGGLETKRHLLRLEGRGGAAEESPACTQSAQPLF
ncbi:methylated-DNA--[protein]-cysteine S-methyltransferase [Boudabousia marimammalium]|uniref:methylated-DNA--[protein]-cysteine S-methyltransferase n=1 Tax=Boudabousia marimammalium TaxID=156892 RepID=A0A1Q5PLX6_9ACTO|nr:methylated-DNA--[protein]-cysteine S-methyltransferase [Boudabousia marimammalium]OKL48049.1 cysteine methyltransferase [Boudabousia marimammalium]